MDEKMGFLDGYPLYWSSPGFSARATGQMRGRLVGFQNGVEVTITSSP